MKTALAALLLCISFNASAEWVARSPNNAGGHIVLLDFKGSCANGMRMYSNNAAGETLQGCWAAGDLHIVVRYDDASLRMYEYAGFEMNPNRQQSKPTKGSSF